MSLFLPLLSRGQSGALLRPQGQKGVGSLVSSQRRPIGRRPVDKPVIHRPSPAHQPLVVFLGSVAMKSITVVFLKDIQNVCFPFYLSKMKKSCPWRPGSPRQASLRPARPASFPSLRQAPPRSAAHLLARGISGFWKYVLRGMGNVVFPILESRASYLTLTKLGVASYRGEPNRCMLFPDMSCMKRAYINKMASVHWSAAKKKER